MTIETKTVIYEMKWPKRFIESGFVREIIGIDKANKELKFEDYEEPIEGRRPACKIGTATFELVEGKMYQIRNTDEEEFLYVMVENNEFNFISWNDVVKSLKKAKQRTRNTDHGTNRSKAKISEENFELKQEIEFIILDIAEAYRFRNEGREKEFQGMIYAIYHYSTRYGVEDEFKKIQRAFQEGKSSDQIRNEFKPIPPNSYTSQSFLSELNVPVLI